MKAKLTVLIGSLYLFLAKATGVAYASGGSNPNLQVQESDLGFRIPNLVDFLSFMIRLFFVLAGLLALFFMLWGALAWVTSGGDKDAVGKARDKIVAAAVGVILIVATLAIIAGLEQIVFQQRVCFGLTCPLSIPNILGGGEGPGDDLDGDGEQNFEDDDDDGDGVDDTAEDTCPGPPIVKCQFHVDCDRDGVSDNVDDFDCDPKQASIDSPSDVAGVQTGSTTGSNNGSANSGSDTDSFKLPATGY